MREEDWEIIEERAYTDSLSRCGDIQAVEAALYGIDYGLRRNPMNFPLVPGLVETHFAKTRLRVIEGSVVPSLRMWFRPRPQDRVVFKLYVEPCPPREMKFGENFWDTKDDDGIPF
ncbi:hypothetical protein [Mesorhizobium sp.]|uniref:hypothetical protein n=1 Tax=Mesorhizobium sp. TaxID=1871066 RepID=UPI000FE914FB|nr:hypothetical protein [Mesorhizobium sp.]RWE30845.1 MAG: hypothetical protein EOS77_18740 [Mesorhizobium sp.]